MSKPQKRDNTYYKERLKSEHPAIHADFLAGKYRVLEDALVAAGLRQKRTRLQELTNAWAKATATEQRDFIRWARGRFAAASPSSRPGPVAVDRFLQPWAKTRISEIKARRGIAMGTIMAELGLARGNGSLGQALRQGTRLQPAVIGLLEKWIEANEHV